MADKIDIEDFNGQNKVRLAISDEALRETTKCMKEVSCLKGEGTELCKVKDCIDCKVHFDKSQNFRYCPYRHRSDTVIYVFVP